MKDVHSKSRFNPGFLAGILLLAAILGTASNIEAQQVKNIVLVHGAFADGSGWKGVFNVLTKKGYHVTVVQNPLTSLEDDVAATKAAIAMQDGPTILVGHSWGGVVITEAGNDPKVVGLVYVAAFEPGDGENAAKWFQSAPPAPEEGILPPNDKGILYYDKSKFHAGFCGDLSASEADFMYASQGVFYAKCLGEPVTHAAWKDKPSYGIVPTEDKSINPVIERNMYKMANAKITEIKGSHVVFISHPAEVAAVIEDAAMHSQMK